MEHVRIGWVGFFISGICLLTLGLSGCGVQQPPAQKETQTEKIATPEAKQEVPVPSTEPITEERTYYDFESNLNGWEVPMWAEEKTDYVARSATLSNKFASRGTGSMEVVVEFPGDIWAAGLVEIQQYLDLSRYRVLSVDIYLPEGAPIGLKAKLIITVGPTWKFVEMSRSVPLIPGEWATITANIEPGSYDWKRIVPDEEFAADVRKIAIRIESNRKPDYSGPIYIDNVRVGR